MSWRDRYLNASFKDVPFYVESHVSKGGINTSNQTESPYKAGTTIEETSNKDEVPKPRKIDVSLEKSSDKRQTFNISCYTIGNDYDIARNKLISAIKDSTSGTLIHPYLGSFYVKCTDWSITETTERSGIAKFSITFEEDIEPSEAYKTNLIAFTKQNENRLASIAKAKELANKSISKKILDKEIAFANKIIKLINTDNIFSRLELTDAIDAYFQTINTLDTIPTLLRFTKTVFVDNFIDNYIKLIAVLQSMNIASSSDNYDSKKELTEIKSSIKSAVDIVANHVDNAELYNSIQRTKSYFIDTLNAKNIADIDQYNIAGELPWLVLANDIYNNITSESELIKLNITQINPVFYKSQINYRSNNVRVNVQQRQIQKF